MDLNQLDTKARSNQTHACTYVLNDHHQKRQLYAEMFLFFGFDSVAVRVSLLRALDECRADVGAGNLKNTRLDVIVCESLDMPVLDTFTPDLQRFRSA